MDFDYRKSPVTKLMGGSLNFYQQLPIDSPPEAWQVSTEEGKIIMGTKLENEDAHNQMLADGWYYDDELDAYVLDLLNEEN